MRLFSLFFFFRLEGYLLCYITKSSRTLCSSSLLTFPIYIIYEYTSYTRVRRTYAHTQCIFYRRRWRFHCWSNCNNKSDCHVPWVFCCVLNWYKENGNRVLMRDRRTRFEIFTLSHGVVLYILHYRSRPLSLCILSFILCGNIYSMNENKKKRRRTETCYISLQTNCFGCS